MGLLSFVRNRKAVVASRATEGGMRIQRSATAFNELNGPQTQGDWGNASSDWKEAMAQKESHNWDRKKW